MKGEKEDNRWGRDVIEKDQGEERFGAHCVEEKRER
jgi:hypothetical protein